MNEIETGIGTLSPLFRTVSLNGAVGTLSWIVFMAKSCSNCLKSSEVRSDSISARNQSTVS